ncbi:hypothetical protein GJ744_011147 [Endocarpon pusillum]|uniref:Uncharacterized protein n=1 Tax=Endocarpon pusillum TaxID=364733 RepID=A0A8H7E4Z5_9EURO|nr:hypothetical protein GJ744_011147 [Endocarpon pusillum]
MLVEHHVMSVGRPAKDVVDTPEVTTQRNAVPQALQKSTSQSTPQATPSLSGLLHKAANSETGVVTYTPNAGISTKTRTTYWELLHVASENARLLHQINGVNASSIFLLHFDTHLDNIVWFWAVTLAGYIPAFSTPLSNDPAQRKRHFSPEGPFEQTHSLNFD